MKKLWLIVGFSSVIGACGGDDGGAAKGTVNPTTARQSVMQASALRGAVDSKNGGMVAGAVLQLNASSQSVVMPATPGAPKALTLEEGPTLAAAETTGSGTCDDKGCTFKDYAQGGSVLNGTVTSSDAADGAKKVVWDLKITSSAIAGAPQVMSFSWDASGDVVVSPTKLDGKVETVGHIDTNAGGQKVSVKWDNLVKYQGIVLNAGAPTAGSIYSRVKMTSSQGGGTAYEGTHQFQ